MVLDILAQKLPVPVHNIIYHFYIVMFMTCHVQVLCDV